MEWCNIEKSYTKYTTNQTNIINQPRKKKTYTTNFFKSLCLFNQQKWSKLLS